MSASWPPCRLAYFTGGVDGFGKGFAAAGYMNSGEATGTVLMLRWLRRGSPSSAIGLLEQQLDDSILANDGPGRGAYGSVFNLPRLMGIGPEELVDDAVAPALTYRSQYPSQMGPSGAALVEQALAHLAERTRGKP